jgi:hypothetical protein
LRIAKGLEVVAAWLVVTQLEGIQDNPIAEQTHAEMEFVPLPGRIGHLQWQEFDVLKSTPSVRAISSLKQRLQSWR